MNDIPGLIERLGNLDRLYELHVCAATFDLWAQHCEVWKIWAHEAAAALDELQARLTSSQLQCRDAVERYEIARKDAERYRWLRENAYLNEFWDGYVDASIDEGIDAALAAGEKP